MKTSLSELFTKFATKKNKKVWNYLIADFHFHDIEEKEIIYEDNSTISEISLHYFDNAGQKSSNNAFVHQGII